MYLRGTMACKMSNWLTIVPLPDDPVKALHGMLMDGPSLTGDLLEERMRDRARDEPDDRGICPR